MTYDVAGAQRPKASERRTVAKAIAGALVSACSTPEGIGTANGLRLVASTVDPVECSTPEGIGTANGPELTKHLPQ